MGAFIISRTLLDTEKEPNLLSPVKFKELVEDTRITYSKEKIRKRSGPKSTTPSVQITRLSDKTIFNFDNYNSART